MDSFPFASCVPFSNQVPLAQAGERSRSGVLLRAASHDAPPAPLLARIEAILGLDQREVLRYADPRRGQHRAMRLAQRDGEVRLEAFLLGGDTRAEAWIRTLLQDELPARSYGRSLLASGAKPPAGVQSRGKPVCTCFNVTDLQIEQQLEACEGDEGARLSALQAALRCGTNCGSCLPELKRMAKRSFAI